MSSAPPGAPPAGMGAHDPSAPIARIILKCARQKNNRERPGHFAARCLRLIFTVTENMNDVGFRATPCLRSDLNWRDLRGGRRRQSRGGQ
ncbi:hypothetical protein EVAR_30057_1 [Eumeta japonica]|uniref:Uncharacterized protein n=1 Tax=Eumeta variegata TaxID=151549 RepID=A0A4C1X7M5_EUMVA|nr:hypothetical protein EVAR_30057_1 [Eumeta japonica]